jgi:proliferating cell nuclear antigen
MPATEFSRIVKDFANLCVEVSKEGVRFASDREGANGTVLLKQTDAARKKYAKPTKCEGVSKTEDEENDDDDDDDDEEEADEEEGEEGKSKKNEKKVKTEDVEMNGDGDEEEDGEEEFKPKSDDEDEDKQDEFEAESSNKKKRKKGPSEVPFHLHFFDPPALICVSSLMALKPSKKLKKSTDGDAGAEGSVSIEMNHSPSRSNISSTSQRAHCYWMSYSL